MQEDFKIKLQYHNVLNPKLWTPNKKLRPEVKIKLIQFAKVWQGYAGISQSAVKDIVMTGGNANFNYTPFSDIDVHLIVDKKSLFKDFGPKLEDLLKAKKNMWTMTHKIAVLGYPLEPYAQDINDKYPPGQGVYSLTKDIWLQEPKFQSGINFKMDPLLKQKVEYWMHLIDDIIDHKMDRAATENIRWKIKQMRQAGISRAGEFSQENLIFKELRNQGYLDKMNRYEKSLVDNQLSLLPISKSRASQKK